MDDALMELMTALLDPVPSLAVPDFAAGPLPTLKEMHSAGFAYSGKRSEGNSRLRDEFVDRHGYAIPCREAIAACLRQGPLVEVGAGVAFWSWLIDRDGGDVVVTDPYARPFGGLPPRTGHAWVPVEALDAAEAIRRHPDRAVLMIWPDLGDGWSDAALDAMRPGQVLVHVGEIGEATGGPRFEALVRSAAFEAIEGVALPNWPGIGDDMEIFSKR